VRVALVAAESAGLRTLRLLLDKGHDIVAVFARTQPDASGAAPVADLAREAGIAVHPSEEVRTAALGGRLAASGVDLLLNVHGLHVVHAEVLRAPRIGAFNLHPGPLPRYAGLNAPSWAIVRGETRHEVTLHWMAPGIDTGPVAYAAGFPLDENATGLSASLACVTHGMPLVERLLDTAAAAPDAIPRHEQDLSGRRYFGREVPYDGVVPWTEPAARVAAFVRACDYGPFTSPWGRPRTWLGGRELRVLRAKVGEGAPEAAPGTVVDASGPAPLVSAGGGCVAVSRVEVDGATADAGSVLREGDRLTATP
jgi:UDP-4-amino-4-deoxy-L-arabinose formyltransferase/UDP-glucuronic acid dehydrogenase (UDP-4-keto-hexauronic acid decarboxylating)